ncbi:hypothetical protein CWC33_12330 [Idiomarina sp. X4]|uniref:SIR2 family protein n=1 Tax=Idiomarina sp. X4 TaxID=2055892 RepID=UPI000C28CC28|nr:SIR2 family protein [Idiomarina sp. X4]ATZ74436.1 hypothetical protein CWC33_12330 [Idiomarina sp. X4]
MRFFSNGPNIPDDLLVARDQGRVVFFCGAGVSRAKAKFSGFFDLAQEVNAKLGVLPESPPAKLLNLASELVDNTDSDGGVSIDRAFGLLERDFATNDIYWAVANALSTSTEVDLSAHDTLLKLATNQEGVTRLVTTNFDRLFELSNPELNSYIAPNLPNLDEPVDFNGVVYLHGKVNSLENGAENDYLVLSSSEFGEAYLAKAWATSFVKSVLERYIVVFVGYAADDPPIKYLLEALNRDSNDLNDIFAFERGTTEEAVARWQHKGVRAVPFSDFKNLWETLDAWAERAYDPRAWYDKVLKNAKRGPKALEPFERGQVAHLMSTIEGSKANGKSPDILSGEWLNVFDPTLRFADLELETGVLFDNDEARVAPINLFRLDSDPEPEIVNLDRPSEPDFPPAGVFDLFKVNDLDKQNIQDSYSLPFRNGQYLEPDVSTLPYRLNRVATWLGSIAKEPETVKWAVKQNSLHPWVIKSIRNQIEFYPDTFPNPIYQAWSYILEQFENSRTDIFGTTSFERRVERNGWSMEVLRKLQSIIASRISVREQYLSSEMWGSQRNAKTVRDYISRDVEYPSLPRGLEVPNQWFAYFMKVLRRDIENSVALEEEIGGFSLPVRESITRDDQPGSNLGRTEGLSGRMLHYAQYYENFIEKDLVSARREAEQWSIDDEAVFSKLHAWVLRFVEVIPDECFNQAINKLSDNVFWCVYHSRDLLISLSSRWMTLPQNSRENIEQRIIKGPSKWGNETDEAFANRRAFSVLNRLEWLRKEGCVLQISDSAVTRLKEIAHDWTPDAASLAAESREPRGGIVSTDSDPSPLNDVPISEVISVAAQLSHENNRYLTETAPFIGLLESRPLKALNAIRMSVAPEKLVADIGWSAFLDNEARKTDKDKLVMIIAERLCGLPKSTLQSIGHSATRWFRNFGPKLHTKYKQLFLKLANTFINLITEDPELFTSAVVDNSKHPDWILCSINSHVGRLAFTIIEVHVHECSNLRFMEQSSLSLLERLLSLPGDLGRYSLIAPSRYVSWFYENEPAWTDKEVLKYSKSEDERDKDAFWFGTLNGHALRGEELFLSLKDSALDLLLNDASLRLRHRNSLARFLWSAWKVLDVESGKRWVSNNELRMVLIKCSDSFRCEMLRNFVNPEEGWINDFEVLLGEVWPYQLVANSMGVKSMMAQIVANSGNEFKTALSIAFRRLKRLNNCDNFMVRGNPSFELYPIEALEFFEIVLPNDAQNWPYGFGDYITLITEKHPEISRDPRFVELKRKWDSLH